MSRYIDAERLIGVLNGYAQFYHVEMMSFGVFIDAVMDMPTADVVERKEFILDGGKCSCHFAEIDGHKNIVFTLYNAVTDITNIRIRLDKYNLAEVVRCKDCVFWEQATDNSGNCNRALEITAYDTDFCSYGERKEDERLNKQTGCY